VGDVSVNEELSIGLECYSVNHQMQEHGKTDGIVCLGPGSESGMTNIKITEPVEVSSFNKHD